MEIPKFNNIHIHNNINNSRKSSLKSVDPSIMEMSKLDTPIHKSMKNSRKHSSYLPPINVYNAQKKRYSKSIATRKTKKFVFNKDDLTFIEEKQLNED